ncbi:MAG: transposase, partial [Limnochordia bacterium]
DIASLLVYSRLLNPQSKKKTFEGKEQFINSKDFELEQVYRTLGFLATEKENLEKHLNKQLSKLMDRNLAVAYWCSVKP